MEALVILHQVFDLLLDSSDSEDEQVEKTNPTVKKNDFAEDVVPNFLDNTFKTHFRVTPSIFEYLCNSINLLCVRSVVPGRMAMEVDKKLMITLWYLGNQECMRAIADRFGVGNTSVWRIVKWCCDIIITLNRGKRFIRWPSPRAAAETAQFYHRQNRIRGIVGLIDRIHVRIRSPKESHDAYRNKNGHHSVILQSVCNHKMEFMYCYTGEVGSIEEDLLLKRSGLLLKIESGNFRVDADQHLLADAAYPLKRWLITPFKSQDCQSKTKHIFNRHHYKCMMTIKRAFGLLKGRFQRLLYIDCLEPSSIVRYIIAACILHNVCIRMDDVDESFILEQEIRSDIEFDSDDEDDEDEYSDDSAVTIKRQSLLKKIIHA